MALNGSFSTNLGNYGVICEWNGAQSIDGNYTDIFANVYVTYQTISITARTVTAVINGTTKTATSPALEGDTSGSLYKTLVASFTQRVVHNTDGTKSVALSVSFPFNYQASNVYVGTLTATDNVTLDPIPKVSRLTAANGTLGTAQTVSVSIPVSGYVNTITATAGSYTQTLATQSAATSLTWQPALEFATAAPYGTNVAVVLTCKTYSGGTLIGESYKTVAMDIPASVKPSISITVEDYTTYTMQYGAPVQGLSALSVRTTGIGAQGSVVNAYTLIIKQGTEIIYTRPSANPTITTSPINASGSITVQVIGTDTRGRTGTATSSLTFMAYERPGITALTVNRCTSGGTAKSDGDHCRVTFSAAISALNNRNSAAYRVLYRVKDSGSAYTSITVTAAAGNYNPTNVSVIFAASTSNAYEICVEAEDDIIALKSGSRVLPIGQVLMQTSADGTGISFGAVAELSNTLDVRMPLRVRDTLTIDNLITQTTIAIDSGGGTARSGDCWAKYDRASHIVELHLHFDAHAPAPMVGLVTIANLPSGYRPPQTTYCPCFSANLQSGYAYISSSGVVTAACATSGENFIIATYHTT